MAPGNETTQWSVLNGNLGMAALPQFPKEHTPPVPPALLPTVQPPNSCQALWSLWASTCAKVGGMQVRQVRHHSPDTPAHFQLTTGMLKPEDK